MKLLTSILIFSFLLLSFIVTAQPIPQEFNYQAVARNAAGVPISNQAIKLRLTIRAEIPTGSVRYAETRSVTTNALGLFTIGIGSSGAESVTGNMSTINWSADKHFLQVELDINNGNNFTNMGTTQLLSVPYALQSQRANIADALRLPFSASLNSDVPLIDLQNLGNGKTMRLGIGNNQSTSDVLEVKTTSVNLGGGIYASKGLSGASITVKGAITAEAGNSYPAIAGYADEDFGIYGYSRESDAIYGLSSSGGKAGISGTTEHSMGDGVVGSATAGHGILGYATSGWAGHFTATTGKALFTSGQIQMDNTGQTRGKTLMTDASGNAHWEGGIAFASSGFVNNLADLIVPAATPILIPFNIESYDLGNNFTTGSSIVDPATFTAPVAGIYHFDAMVLWNSFSNMSASTQIFLKINGNNSFYSRQAVSEDRATSQLSVDIALLPGDKVNVWVYHSASTTEYISYFNGTNRFSGRFVMKN